MTEKAVRAPSRGPRHAQRRRAQLGFPRSHRGQRLSPRVASAADHDRNFRPDVQGLRAVAVAVVVLYHVGVPGIGGGYVGVDVFFVISGFVITKLLLRQSERTGRPRFAEFYARRARRILPAAGLVALVALFATYKWLGFIQGDYVASDTRWVAVFLGNVHFSSVGTNYLQSQLPPSPLQNYWSLAVEEQFYVVYPAAMALICILARGISLRTKMMIFTGAVFLVSFAWSAYYTAIDPTGSYFSTTTRAWELALGGFVAAGTFIWGKLARPAASAVAWAGIAAIAVSVTVFSTTIQYPGWLAIVPVGGAALAIAGGVNAGRTGPEVILGTLPFLWIGDLSFSIYLWHWPILTIANEDATKPLRGVDKFLLVVAITALSAVTYYLYENPIRRSKRLGKTPWLSIAVGLVIVAVMLGVATWEIHAHSLG
jgi:peptidoglycan/LPS O-acetylase OafA/YrhL